MKIHEEIRDIRKRLRRTQKEFSAMLGVSQAAYSKYEYGMVIPKADIYLKIKALGATCELGHTCRNCGMFHRDTELCPNCGTDPHYYA